MIGRELGSRCSVHWNDSFCQRGAIEYITLETTRPMDVVALIVVLCVLAAQFWLGRERHPDDRMDKR